MFKKGALTGVLLFGMFFGAGNLIFPITMGALSGNQFTPAVIGFVVSAVGIAAFTVVVALITGRSYEELTTILVSKKFAVIFLLALYLSIGPLFSIPRTAATSFSVGIEPLLESSQKTIALLVFSVLYFIATYFLSIKPNQLMDRVGKVLTPLFAGMIVLVVVLGLLQLPNAAMNTATTEYSTIGSAFGSGLLEGYNTLDALAAVAFSVIAMNTLSTFGFSSKKEYKKIVYISAMSIVILFTLLYIGLALLGNHFTLPHGFEGNIGTYILSQMTQRVFGQPAQLFLAVMVIVTCMTTTVGLVVSISKFFEQLFPKFNYAFYVRVFCVLGIVVANFGLSAIIQFAIPVLLLLYPITLTLDIIFCLHQVKDLSKLGVRLTVGVVTVIGLMQAISNFSQLAFIKSLLAGMPLNDFGMPWVAPALIGMLLAIILPQQKIAKMEQKGE